MQNKIIIGCLVGVIILSVSLSLFAVLSKEGSVSDPPSEGETVIDAATEAKNAELKKFRKLDGATVVIPFAKKILEQTIDVTAAETDRTINFHTSHDAFMNLLDKKADVILSTYPSEEELDAAEEEGIELDITPILQDALVFLVSNDNPVRGLSSQQIRQIYSGTLTQWAAVGGANAAIAPLQRSEDSVSQADMTSFMGSAKWSVPFNEHIYEEKETLMAGVTDVYTGRYTLSYSYKFLVDSLYVKDTVRMLSLDGITPTKDNITRGRYPQVVFYYVITRKGDESDFAKSVKTYALSAEGQNLAEELGYVKL